MKKLALLLAIALLLGCFAGCGKEKNEEDTLNAPTESIPVEGEFDHVHAPGEHVYLAEVMSEADCVNSGKTVHICALCGEGFEEIMDAYGHQFEPATCDQNGCCVNCGAVVEKAVGHTTKHGTCERCGMIVG